jgi:hypothetical protein
MGISTLLLCLYAAVSFLGQPVDESVKLIIQEKRIAVQGRTSLGGFTCRYADKNRKDTLFVDFSAKTPDLLVDIVVDDFGCGNFMLNRDFKKTLKSKEFPKARVRVGNIRTSNSKYFCDLTVNMVGKKLDFPNLELVRNAEGVTAQIGMGFSTLGLEPPSKMGGLVTVDEELKLEIFLGFRVGR